MPRTLRLITLTIAIFSVSLLYTPREDDYVRLELPAPGHWLMTNHDLALAATKRPVKPRPVKVQVRLRAPVVTKKPAPIKEPPLTAPQHDYFHGNRSQDNINIGVMWVDGKKLKAFTITTINPVTKKAAVAGVPLFAYNTSDPKARTAGQLYRHLGPQGFIRKMEIYFETDIDYNIVLEHSTFIKISELIGEFRVGKETTTCLKIFEETAADRRHDDEQVVRAVAAKVLAPESWLMIPKIVFILTREIDLDLSPREIYGLYQEFRACKTNEMQKNSLAGSESHKNGRRTRAVEPEQWANIIYRLTN